MLIIITSHCHQRGDLFFPTYSLRQNSVTLYTLLMRTSTLLAPRWQRSKMHTTCVSSSSLALANTSSAKQTFQVVAIGRAFVQTVQWLVVRLLPGSGRAASLRLAVSLRGQTNPDERQDSIVLPWGSWGRPTARGSSALTTGKYPASTAICLLIPK